MPTEFFSSDVTGPYTIDDGDTVFMQDGYQLTSQGNGFDFLGSGALTLAGDVYATKRGLYGGAQDARVDIQLGTDASILSGAQAVGLFENLANLYLNNAGQISAFSNAVSVDSHRVHLINSGSISGDGHAVWLRAGAPYAGAPVYSSVSVTNTGVMTSSAFGIAAALNVTGYDSVTVLNQGTLMGQSESIRSESDHLSLTNTGTIVGFVATSQYSDRLTVTNAGVMQSDSGESVLSLSADTIIENSGTMGGIEQSSDTDSFRLINSGSIGNTGIPPTDPGYAVQSGAQDVRIWNHGEIAGHIGNLTRFDQSAMIVNNSGIVFGDIYGDARADRYVAHGDGLVMGVIDLGGGEDTVIGSAAADRIAGNTGNDSLIGRGGNDEISAGDGDDLANGGDGHDSLTGGAGKDTLLGGNGDDDLLGDDDADRLFGGDGSDTLDGGAGNDTLYGGNGDDTLTGASGDDRLFGGAGVNDFIGGAGRDVMYAQTGEDSFVFFDSGESKVGARRDVIYGYDLGQDQIDLAAVAPGVLSFIGTSAFSGSAREVRLIEYASGSTVVQVDVDASGTADMELMIYRVQGLTEDDFIL